MYIWRLQDFRIFGPPCASMSHSRNLSVLSSAFRVPPPPSQCRNHMYLLFLAIVLHVPALVWAASRRHLSRDAEKAVVHGRRRSVLRGVRTVGRDGHLEPQTVDHQVWDQLELLVVRLSICLNFLAENLRGNVLFPLGVRVQEVGLFAPMKKHSCILKKSSQISPPPF